MQNSRIRFFLSVVGMPVMAAVSLRLVLKYILPTKIGWIGTQDFDLFVPVVLSGFGLAELLYRHKTPSFAFSPKSAFGTMLLFLAVLCATSFKPETNGHAAWQVTILAVLILTIASTVFWFVRPGYFLNHPHRWLLLPMLMLALSIPLYNHLGNALWITLGPLTSDSVCLLASSLKPDVTCLMHEKAFMEIGSKQFTVLIAQGCDGLAGLFLWVVCWGTALSLFPRLMSPAGWMIFAGVGLLNVWLLNLVRIVTLFFMGAPLLELLGFENGVWAFEFLFHSQLGFLLYGAGIFATLHIALHSVNRRSATKWKNPIVPETEPL